MVPDSPDVEGVVSGPEGVFANAKQGALWIDASSIRPDVAKRLADDDIGGFVDRLDRAVGVTGALAIGCQPLLRRRSLPPTRGS